MSLTNFSAIRTDAMGSYTVVTADATANLKDISVAKAFDTDLPIGCLVQIYRSNVNVTGDAVITLTPSTKTLRVADGSTYNMTAGDVINYMVY